MKKCVLVTLLLACVVALGAQSALPPPFPHANATKLLDTDRLTVWDIVWAIAHISNLTTTDMRGMWHRGVM